MVERTSDLAAFVRTLADAPPLGAAARARRDAMRSLLLSAVRRRRRRRRALPAIAALLFTAAVLGLVFHAPRGAAGFGLQHADYAVVRDDPARTAAWRTAARPRASIELAVVRDAAAVAGWIVRDRRLPADVLLDDGELLRLLAAADRHTGLWRGPYGVFLTEDVVDRPSVEP